ncbi:MAG: hydrogenase maturation nickel metallochaperone HypA [Bacteroidota bacterium]|nr:hydrogenase maturation nickel metallochaperone HypA [Bacteroidota bacterium]
MHELSLAWDVIEMISHEAEERRLKAIYEIRIEIGLISGVEADTFSSVLDMIRGKTILEQARIDIIRTPGKGRCSTCNLEFLMQDLFTLCPRCGSIPSSILSGKEFRVLSLQAD